MRFLPSKGDPDGPIDMIQVNWYYRPRDIMHRVNSPRLLIASMQSDTCPLSSLRGKCTIKHRDEIDDLDAYRRQLDTFYFDQFYDRYMIRYYAVIPTTKVINVPAHVKKVLDERWRYVIVERGSPKEELCQRGKTCKRCSLFAPTSESVDCAECKATYHMKCVDPPLLRKPQRGFAWTCAACARARERKLEARKTSYQILNRRDGLIFETESQASRDPDVDSQDAQAGANAAADGSLPDKSPAESDSAAAPLPVTSVNESKPTADQQLQSQLWPFRYFGVHSQPEDVLDFDDRINPRAKSRVGKKHQADVPPWHGHSVVYVRKKKKGGRGGGGSSERNGWSDGSTAYADIDWPGKATGAPPPEWITEEPAGYIPRGEDGPVIVNGKEMVTAELLWKVPDSDVLNERISDERDQPATSDVRGDAATEDQSYDSRLTTFMEHYMVDVRSVALAKNIKPYSTNYLDAAIKFLFQEGYATDKALRRLRGLNRYADLKEPHLRPDQVKAFEAGVAKFGSELAAVSRHVATVPHKHIVRFYYMWKKTARGKQIWGNHEARRSKQARKALENNPEASLVAEAGPSRLLDDIADDQDDSAFDTGKAQVCKKGFICKFCNATRSREWRRAPWTNPGATMSPEDMGTEQSRESSSVAGPSPNGSQTSGAVARGKDRSRAAWPLAIALCQSCAVLWRKYAMQWENPDELAKRIIANANKSGRRRTEEEVLAQLLIGSEADIAINATTAAFVQGLGVDIVPAPVEEPDGADKRFASDTAASSKKRGRSDREATASATDPTSSKKQRGDKTQGLSKAASPMPEPPLTPEPPRVKMLPCAVCGKVEPQDDEYLTCIDCRLAVHRACYGVPLEPPAASEARQDGADTEVRWVCDTCANDREPRAILTYKCALCPVDFTEQELMEPPRFSHKRKTDREREKERLEREMVIEAIRLYRERQLAIGKPTDPREPLKRTEANNWVHVHCAVYHPEVKFGDATRLEPAEGLGLIARERRLEICKLCRRRDDPATAVIACRHASCTAQFHVGCARKEGYILGFGLMPTPKQAIRNASNKAPAGLGEVPAGPV
ncbi:putative PHD type zinc finger protein with BAH domain-containing protein, partial [Ascosphaera acerosa]